MKILEWWGESTGEPALDRDLAREYARATSDTEAFK
jgi:hypothetical protein